MDSQIKYITFREPNDKGSLLYYILQKAFPHFQAVLSIVPANGSLADSPIAGYHLYVVIEGTIRGKNIIPAFNNVTVEMQAVANDMAAWYLENRILPDERKYKKWKIISHVPSADK